MKFATTQYHLSLCMVFLFSFAACGSDNDESRSLRDKVLSENQTYFFFESNHSIAAVDPGNPQAPIVVEPFNDTLQAPVIAQESITINTTTRERFAVRRNLFYAKNGGIWQIDGLLDASLATTQVSNENNAYNICSASAVSTTESKIYYRYSLQNTAPDCFAVYNYPNDLIHKSVELNTRFSQAPTLINTHLFSTDLPDADVTFTEYDYVTGESLIGKLVVESNSDLYWYDSDATPSSAILVASNITGVNALAGISNNRMYLNVDGGLYLYEAGSDTLGPQLHTFLTESPRITFDSFIPTKDIYIIDGNTISSMPINGSTQANLIFEDNSIQGTMYFYRQDDSRLIIHVYGEVGNGESYYSLSLSGDEKLKLFDIEPWQWQVDRSPYITTNGSYIYYSDGVRFESGMVSFDGKVKVLFPDTLIIGRVETNFLQPVTSKNFQRNSHLLLLQKITDSEQYLLSTFNLGTNRIERQLGTLGPEAIRSEPIITFPNNGNAIFTASGENSREVFFINLNRDNSLMQITNNEVDEKVIDTYWIFDNWF